MKRFSRLRSVAPLLALLGTMPLCAQGSGHLGIKGLTEPDEPAKPQPAAAEFKDGRFGVSFRVPAGWTLARKDGELTTYRTEVRSASRGAQVRAVATINYNPYPPTTFAGAAFYFSAVPGSTAAACQAQASGGTVTPQPDANVAGVSFRHGSDRQGGVCVESRDDIYMALRNGACLRFDLVVNTFCSQSSGAMPLNDRQLGDIDTRLRNILSGVRIVSR